MCIKSLYLIVFSYTETMDEYSWIQMNQICDACLALDTQKYYKIKYLYNKCHNDDNYWTARSDYKYLGILLSIKYMCILYITICSIICFVYCWVTFRLLRPNLIVQIRLLDTVNYSKKKTGFFNAQNADFSEQIHSVTLTKTCFF